MKKLIFIFTLFGFFGATYAQQEDAFQLEIGMKAPMTALKLKDIDGQLYTLKDEQKEKGLILVFSCNTCPFVVGSETFKGWEVQYNALAEYARSNNLGFVLVNSNQAKREKEDSMEEMQKHAKDMEYTMHYLMDSNSTLANAFGAKTTPHVYVFDATMKLVYKGAIDNSWDSKREEDSPYLKMAIDQISAGEEVQISETAPKGCSIKRL